MERVIVDPDEPVRDYWKRRLRQHHGDTYKGRPLVKIPEDLRTYQHLIEDTRPDVIVELGTWAGGSAIWFADQLDVLLGHGRKVITLDTHDVQFDDDRIVFIRGDLRHVVDKVGIQVGAAERVMVIDDAAHTFDVSLDALRLYSPFVPAGSAFVVEDTIVDTEFNIWPGGPVGAGKAVDAFLAENDRFTRMDGMAPYGITMHMGGWLRATR